MFMSKYGFEPYVDDMTKSNKLTKLRSKFTDGMETSRLGSYLVIL